MMYSWHEIAVIDGDYLVGWWASSTVAMLSGDGWLEFFLLS